MENVVRKIGTAETNARKEALRTKVNELMNVSTIPAVLNRIVTLTENPNAVLHELEQAIERDQAIAMRVVAASNAAYYGFSRKISTISQAIIILGFDMVRGLAITTSVFNSIPVKNKETVKVLWAHSFETAQAAMLIARKAGFLNKESAFLAGLFHDIGRPVLFQVSGADSGINVFERNTVEKEEEVFGASHAEAGSWFAEKFNLPEDCIEAIKYHHSPAECSVQEKRSPLAAITYLANQVADDAKAEVSADQDAVLSTLKMTREDLSAIAEEIASLRESTRSFYL